MKFQSNNSLIINATIAMLRYALINAMMSIEGMKVAAFDYIII